MFGCISCSNDYLNKKIDAHVRDVQVICLVGVVVGAILLGLSFYHFPPGSATGAILTSDRLRYAAVSCFLLATLDSVILCARKERTAPPHNHPGANQPSEAATIPFVDEIIRLLNQAEAHDRAKRYPEMIACYTEAAALNSSEALAILGDLYQYSDNHENPRLHDSEHHGKGIVVDRQKAFNCYSRAATMNHPHATCELGHCYRFGWGVEKNEAQAFACYRKAFEDPRNTLKTEAAGSLAICYEEGIGTSKDLARAEALRKEYPRPIA